MSPQHQRATLARHARAARSQRRALRTVAGVIAWLALTDVTGPATRRAFDSDAAWADR